MIFFTADTHFGHENIIKFANRPYNNVADMDKDLIEGWNKKHFGAWHLFGHDHRHTNDDTEFKLNVGVEAWDYKPVSLTQIHEVMLSRGWHKDWRQFA